MATVKLAFTKISAKTAKNRTPWVFLHGMMGKKNNFQSFAKNKAVSASNDAYLLDLRNHGDSPHSDEMTIPLMAEDVVRFLDENDIEKANVLGHSLGGRVLIDMAINHPQRVANQIVVDIGPFDYYDAEKFPYTIGMLRQLRQLSLMNLKN